MDLVVVSALRGVKTPFCTCTRHPINFIIESGNGVNSLSGCPVFWLVSNPVRPLTDLANRILDPVVAIGPVATELGPAEFAKKLGSPICLSIY